MLKRLREWWIYWRYRNITRRRQLVQVRLRARRRPSVGRAFPARGQAMYMPRRRGHGRGLVFVTLVAAVLAVVNTLLGPRMGTQFGLFVLDAALLAGITYAYLQFGGV